MHGRCLPVCCHLRQYICCHCCCSWRCQNSAPHWTRAMGISPLPTPPSGPVILGLSPFMFVVPWINHCRAASSSLHIDICPPRGGMQPREISLVPHFLLQHTFRRSCCMWPWIRFPFTPDQLLGYSLWFISKLLWQLFAGDTLLVILRHIHPSLA